VVVLHSSLPSAARRKHLRQSAVPEERNQLAGEIHDSRAQFFTAISMQLGVAKEVIKPGPILALPK